MLLFCCVVEEVNGSVEVQPLRNRQRIEGVEGFVRLLRGAKCKNLSPFFLE